MPGLIHYVYLVFIIVLIALLLMRKNIVFLCILGLLAIGYLYTGSIIKSIQTVYNGVIYAGNEFWSIIVNISFIVAMSTALRDTGADEILIKPIGKLIRNKSGAFWVLGLLMLFVSLLIWPSPAVALVGAILLPAAVKAGLKPIWAAVAMNLFGHGAALSADFFIQGAPGVTAKTLGLDNAFDVIAAGLPIWAVMSIVAILASWIMMRREDKKQKLLENTPMSQIGSRIVHALSVGKVRMLAVFTALIFIFDIVYMFTARLKGGEAAALISGTSILILILASYFSAGLRGLPEKLSLYLRDGFLFGIKTFAPVLVVAAFFFLGGQSGAEGILGSGASGYLNDWGVYLSQKIDVTKHMAVVMQTILSCIAGLGGSGFSALPLTGTFAKTLSNVSGADPTVLAALGQTTAMWVGGGTLIPWGVIPVAAICNIDPNELVKKNLLPVGAGIFAAMLVTMLLVYI